MDMREAGGDESVQMREVVKVKVISVPGGRRRRETGELS